MVHVRLSAKQSICIHVGGWVTHRPQCCKVLLQGHVALESQGLVTRARLASTDSSQDYKFSEEAAEIVFVEIFER